MMMQMKSRKVNSNISSQVLPAIHLEDPSVVVVVVVVLPLVGVAQQTWINHNADEK